MALTQQQIIAQMLAGQQGAQQPPMPQAPMPMTPPMQQQPPMMQPPQPQELRGLPQPQQENAFIGADFDVAGGSWAENIDESALTGTMKTDAQRTAASYGALMSELEDYDKIYKEGGQAVLPGGQKDALTTSRRAIQLQLKELFNLGVLNGPDLDLMDSMLIDPTGVSNSVMDFFGVEFDDRFSNNIGQVRGILDNIMTAKMEAAGIKPPEKEELDDAAFLKSLGL